MESLVLIAFTLTLPLAGAKAVVFTTKTNLDLSDPANDGRKSVANH